MIDDAPTPCPTCQEHGSPVCLCGTYKNERGEENMPNHTPPLPGTHLSTIFAETRDGKRMAVHIGRIDGRIIHIFLAIEGNPAMELVYDRREGKP
jgi:hypothetical protein